MGTKTKSFSIIFLIVTFVSGPVFIYFGYGPAVKAVAALKSMGAPGVFIFCAFFLLGTLIFFPLSLLSFAAGVLYGLPEGFLISWFIATAGACLAFLLSRYAGRGWFHHKMSGNQKFQTFCERVKKNDWKITLLCRLNLLFPYTASNYAFGITKMSFTRYTFVTFLGLIPDILLYVYLGTISGSIVAYFKGTKNFTTAEIIIMAFAAVSSIVLIVYVFLMTRNLSKDCPKSAS